MQVTRSGSSLVSNHRLDFEKWVYADFLADTIINCFARLRLPTKRGEPPVYRICQIVEVFEDPDKAPYLLGTTRTRTLLHCQVANSSTRPFPMELFSNSPFTEAEWDRFKKTYEHEKKELPQKSLSVSKAADLATARAHAFTAVCRFQLII
jgi:RNA polymerase-associated protein RTF1